MRRPRLAPAWAGLALMGLAAAGPARADAAPAAPAAPSLCSAAETTVFDCPLAGGRRAAVCASADLSASAGTLQYRFGRPGKVELQWPPASAAPAADWRAGVKAGQVMYAGGGGAYLRFAAPPFDYVVYSASGRGWGRKAGVMVLKDGQQAAVRRCTAPARSRMNLAFKQQAGLATDEPELELPGP
ncbi:MAG: hypothetical protein LCI02_27835 [Proteobacteria bacterium]|nr:hypothetical protein [Pseudomonadota bacterium]